MVLTARQVLLESEKNFFFQHSVIFTFDGTVLKKAQLGAVAGSCCRDLANLQRHSWIFIIEFLGQREETRES